MQNTVERPRNKFFVEPLNADLYHVSSLKTIEFSKRTKFQDMDIVHLGSFGRCLVLDNKLQSAESDEMNYHETLVHPAMLLHPNPKKVFIGGGGEGATLREVLKHKSVEECVMVDIDGICVEMCKEHLKQHHQGAFEDKRTTLIYDDAKKLLEEAKDGEYDVIILDLADPVDGGPCYQLYTKEFYELCSSKLSEDGVLVTQSGPCGTNSCTDVFSPIYKTFSVVFDKVYPMKANVPSFLEDYGYQLASKKHSMKDLTPDEVDKRIASRIEKGHDALLYYDGITHTHVTSIPKQIRKALVEEKRVLKKDNYVFMKSSEEAATLLML